MNMEKLIDSHVEEITSRNNAATLSSENETDQMAKSEVDKKINNQLEVFRLKFVKEFQENEVLCSLWPRKRPYVALDHSKMENEEKVERTNTL